jgi:cell division septal protein FtsQ
MKSKPRNERLSNAKVRKQQHLLEVTVRRDKAVSMRNRAVLAFVCKTFLAACLAIGAWIGGKELLRRFLWENPDYLLTDVRVASDGALTCKQILEAAQIVEGRNIFTFNLAKARAELDALPQIERAEIQRVLPSRIDITVTERKPIAWVTSTVEENPLTSKEAFLIDARGVVMRSKVLLPEYEHLPVISGVVLGNFAPGQRVNSFEMQAALDLVRLDADNTRWQARHIDLKKGYCLEVTDNNHAKITFGLDHVDQQFERLFRYLDLVEPTKKEILTVNLMVERNTPITFALPESEQPPAPVPVKPSATPAPSKSPTTVKPAIPVVKPAEAAASNRPPATAASTPPPGPASSHKPASALTKPFRAH